MLKVSEQRVRDRFKDKSFFTREELFNFFKEFDPELKETTFRWRIHELKKHEIIKSLKRGVFVISNKSTYLPEVSPSLIQLAKKISKSFSEINYCIWDTSWLNEFTQHQTTSSKILVEIEKGFEESLFYELKDTTRKEVYLNPDEKAIDLYISESNQPVIVKKLLTRAPLTNQSEGRFKFLTPSLEKIMVDLFSDEKLFFHLQGPELIYIYENAIANYTINYTTLFSYAKRREKENDIKQFMLNHIYHLVKEIIE
jgi:hypothetical protein